MITKRLGHFFKQAFRSHSAQPKPNSKLDPNFYRALYPDLASLRGTRKLKAHFAKYGSREGRHPNLGSLLAHYDEMDVPLPADFDVGGYRIRNHDLAKSLDTDQQYILHYLHHGRSEGRHYELPQHRIDQNSDALNWAHLFKADEFIAASSAWLLPVPRSVNEAMTAFIEVGIQKLSPISFDYSFDADFYRRHYRLDAIADDIDLYRYWLETGVLSNQFPNEQVLLSKLYGIQQMPCEFSNDNYQAWLRRKGRRNKRFSTLAAALEHYISVGIWIDRHGDMLRGDPAFAKAIGNYFASRGHHDAALVAYRSALVGADGDAALQRHLGDACRGQRNIAEAENAYAEALRLGANDVAPLLHLTSLATRRRDFFRAERLLSDHKAYSRFPQFWKCLDDFAQHWFDSVWQRHLDMSLPLDRSASDAEISSTIDRIAALYDDILPLIGPVGRNAGTQGYVCILANVDLPQCRFYRVEQKQFLFDELNVEVRIFPQARIAEFVAQLHGARAAIFYRVAAFPQIIKAMVLARKMGVRTYYEIDDLIFDEKHYPDAFESYEDQITKAEYRGLMAGTTLFSAALRRCDRAIASTTPLADLMAPWTIENSVIVVRNGIDDRLLPELDMKHPRRSVDDPFHIVYGSGTKAHNRDFNVLVGPALCALFDRYPQARLTVIGHLKLSAELAAFGSRIRQIELVESREEYVALLSAHDVNLAVLSTGVAADCKSEIKWTEAAVCRIPSIVSPTATYLETVADGVTGFIARETSDWQRIMAMLIEDPLLTSRVGEAACAHVTERYSMRALAKGMADEFAQPLTHKTPQRLRILVVNVFYAPQTFGGATRVVVENIAYLQRRYPEFEFLVLTTDDGSEEEGVIRYDAVDGVPVIRIGTPAERNREWRFKNEKLKPIFDALLTSIQPDLMHVHCIQRLTGSVVEAAIDAEIPYIVTLHDCWWISDFQFLIDQHGLLAEPTASVPESLPDGVTEGQSVLRRRYLAKLLMKAERRLAVSSPFAEVYRSAGVADVDVLENGVPTFMEAPLPRRGTQLPLSVYHIGGRSAHKGTTLIEGAFRQNAFPNLKLNMVDGALARGQRVVTHWGANEVTLIGPVPQSAVAELYRSMDVLLAPSIWPESYGLVSREARHYGVWVVASDAGAMAGDIEDGIDGDIIPANSSAHLTAVLKRLNDHPDLALKRQPAQKPMRSMDQQAEDLAELYHALMTGRRNEQA